jgi:hypothetical protein
VDPTTQRDLSPEPPSAPAPAGAGERRAVEPPTTGGTRRIEDLPKEVGVMLLSVGALGFVLPAVAGTPAMLAGGMVLWPHTFGKLERWLQRRYPVMHREGMRQVARYLDDLERRFPDSTRS